MLKQSKSKKPTKQPINKYIYFKCELLPVIEQHEDGHLEGRNLQDVLSCVGASYLCSPYSKFRSILLQKNKQKTDLFKKWQ